MEELPNQDGIVKSKRKILVKCDKCDFVRELRRDYYNSLIKNNKNVCSSCAIKIAHSEGKCKLPSNVKSEISKKAWSNTKLLEKHRLESISRNTTEEYRKTQSDRTKKLWLSEEYKKRVSDGVKAVMNEDMKKQISEILKNKWANEQQKEKYSNSLKKRWLSEAYRETMREIHYSPKYKEKMAEILANNPKVSSIQLLLYKYLEDLGIQYFKEGSDTKIGYYVFDCLIPKQGNLNKSILIECQGDYWHSISKNIRNDKSKFTYIDRYFPEFEIMYLWEREFSTKDKIVSKLKTKLNLERDILDFNFDNVDVKECSYKEASEFLDAYHYIGKGRGGICVGAYLDNILIGCIVYSKKLRQNQNYGQDFRELSRLCIHPNYQKKNFGSWFISRSYRFLDVKLIISFADTTSGHTGAVYKASNFKFSHETSSDYWYVDKDGFVMHKRTLYSQAVRLRMTESEYAEKYNFHKKYGGKKICYIKQI